MIRASRRRFRPIASLVVALFLLAACSGGGANQAAASSVPTRLAITTTTAMTSETTDAGTPTTRMIQTPQTTQSAANTYLALIAPTNQMVALYDGAGTANDKLQDLNELSALLGLFATELQHLTWPTSAQGAVTSLATAARATQTAADRLVSTPNEQTAAAFTASVGALSASSSRVRLALGLPPVG